MSSAASAPANDRGRAQRLTLATCRNPLARATDRVEVAVRAVVVGLWLLALPIAATVGSVVWADLSVTVADQQQSRISTTAQLLEDAPFFVYDTRGIPLTESVLAQARWVARDGSERTGAVATAAGGRAGDRVRIWVDRSGAVTEPPSSPLTAIALVVVATGGALLAWGVVLFIAWRTFRWRLNLSRMTNWDREWEQFEPRWSGR